MPTDSTEGRRATNWLAIDLAELAFELGIGRKSDEDAADFHFDVTIVGSGYGGAMVLNELAGYSENGQPLRIAMLERGSEYLPGAFPSRMSDLAGHVRFNTYGQSAVRGREAGLFDVRVGPDVGMLLASGLGGGSLINAGVMQAPLPSIFQDTRWPSAIRNDKTLGQQLEDVKTALEATSSAGLGSREAAMNALAGTSKSLPADITVARRDHPDRGVQACNECGDCATGCNFKAKLSVDVTLIAEACTRHDACRMRIVTGATVFTFRKLGPEGYELSVFHTDTELRRRQVKPFLLRTRKLILAAGTMGSTELLMRARSDGMPISVDKLGKNFSANGDNLSALYSMDRSANAVADEDTDFPTRRVGPTITRMLDLRTAERDSFVVEDMAIPGPLRRLFEETVTMAAAVESLTTFNDMTYGKNTRLDEAGIDAGRIDRSMVLALIGHDNSGGELCLARDPPSTQAGTLGVRWPELRVDRRLDKYHEELTKLSKRGHPSATLLANPMWRPLPASIENLFGGVRGPTITVHPLGGCVMGETAKQGVVNALGQVFNGDESAGVHEDLVVLDGSIIPTSLGINPSLTIATLARRSIRQLRDKQWGFERTPQGVPNAFKPRPTFRQMDAPVPQSSTCFELNERMAAEACMRIGGERVRCKVEVQLRFEPQDVARLINARSGKSLIVDAQRSRMRIYSHVEPAQSPAVIHPAEKRIPESDIRVLMEAPLSGEMRIMPHAATRGFWRAAGALWSWFRNRGLRDIVGKIRDRLTAKQSRPPGSSWLKDICDLARSAWNLASHAGDRRLIEYELTLGQPVALPKSSPVAALSWNGKGFKATKTLTYERSGNPLNQLIYAKVLETPKVAGLTLREDLKVDLPYFGRVGAPLLRITSQADHARALVDLASFSLYLARVILPLHAWTLRLPDRAAPRIARAVLTPIEDNGNSHRLPQCIPGLAEPVYEVITMNGGAQLCLTRYLPPDKHRVRRSVLLIHGYSASGTTFAHRRLPGGGLAGALYRSGYDVWVLDMRSSAGMKTAQENWSFEQMGCQDIPCAVDHIVKATDQKQIDVVAHCMGAAMLSLGLFGTWKVAQPFDSYPELRSAMPGRIRRLVFSQVGPYVVMSPANTARAYLFSWARHYLKMGKFEFQPANPGVADDMLDRLLNAVPYPREDFAIENPFWRPFKKTAWVGPRHRMDALYGITFKLANMEGCVLDAIDDFFGPLSLETVAQVIAFARDGVVSDRSGSGDVCNSENIARRIGHCRVLCLHAAENGLADIATRSHLMQILDAAKLNGASVRLEGMGHQDSLIGKSAPSTYQAILAFLMQKEV